MKIHDIDFLQIIIMTLCDWQYSVSVGNPQNRIAYMLVWAAGPQSSHWQREFDDTTFEGLVFSIQY